MKIAGGITESHMSYETSLLYTSKSKDETLEKIILAYIEDRWESWRCSVDGDKSIYGITRDLIESEDYTRLSERLGISMNSANVTKYCLSFDDNCFMKRTFNKSDLTSINKNKYTGCF